MSQTIKIKKGLDIHLHGAAGGDPVKMEAKKVGIIPDDFEGFTWKCLVKEGQEVLQGSPLLTDKNSGILKIVSPVAGKVEEIRRGERRKILAIIISNDGSEKSEVSLDLALTPEAIRIALQESGIWAMMRQRPFDVVPDPESNPRDIFVTAFDSAPLAPVLWNNDSLPYIEKGLEILQVISGKKPFIAFSKNHAAEVKNGNVLIVEGPHPAGNVGVQIAALKPIDKGDVVWTLNVETLIRIGRLYVDGKANWETVVALTGPEFKNPHLVKTIIGVDMQQLLHNQLKQTEDVRIISGNVLTGKRVDPWKGFLRYPYHQVTAIAEGATKEEFMGWASLNPSRYSVKRTFPAFLKGLSKPFNFDARIKGGRRAMILSGEYDKVFPFDIYPEYLLRAMIEGDVDRMEKLGIYEVAPEDFALPEFVDTSKQELQKIVRESLDKIRKDE